MADQYVIMVANYTKNDCNIDLYGAYNRKQGIRKLVDILEEHGFHQAEDMVVQHDWDEGDFKAEDVGCVIQMTGVPHVGKVSF